MKSPELTRFVNREGTMHGFNLDDVLNWAMANSVTYRYANDSARILGCDDIQRLKMILVAFVKDEERREEELAEHIKTNGGAPSVMPSFDDMRKVPIHLIGTRL